MDCMHVHKRPAKLGSSHSGAGSQAGATLHEALDLVLIQTVLAQQGMVSAD